MGHLVLLYTPTVSCTVPFPGTGCYRGRGGKKASFFGYFTRFCWSELDRPRVKVALHDESYVWLPKSQDFAKVQGSGFHENREKAMSLEITLFEVGFFSYSV